MKPAGFFSILLIQLFLFIPSISLHSQTGKNAALEALGGSSGLLLYNTYVAIGGIADAYAVDVYTTETVVDLMNEQVSGMAVVKKQNEALLVSGFLTDEEDSLSMVNINQCLVLLMEQAEALKNYANSNTDANSDAFQTARKKSWGKICEILEIKNDLESK